MNDIFLSYSREDEARAGSLAGALEARGWSVWWDRSIPAGKSFDEVIEAAIYNAKCVVVIWSASSVKSRWVLTEAEEGADRGILVPVRTDDVPIPFAFRRIHAADLVGWNGSGESPAFLKLAEAIETLLGTVPAREEPRRKAEEGRETASKRQAESKREPESFKDCEICPEMVRIPGGEFLMGSKKGEGDLDETPEHPVRITPFAIGKYEVTFAEYDMFANATNRDLPDDEGWGRENRPVINVSWHDAVAYAAWLSDQTGKRYRLPTEAEWEYAARAGTRTAYWWGNDVGRNHANCNGCGSQWDDRQTAPVGSFPANPFGLSDTAGNVWEWVQDCWHENYQDAPEDGSKPWGEEDGGDCARRVLRGGSWGYFPGALRSAPRIRYAPGFRFSSGGFRLAQDL